MVSYALLPCTLASALGSIRPIDARHFPHLLEEKSASHDSKKYDT